MLEYQFKFRTSQANETTVRIHGLHKSTGEQLGYIQLALTDFLSNKGFWEIEQIFGFNYRLGTNANWKRDLDLI